MKRLLTALLFLFVFTLSVSVKAQEETLDLDLTRDWGYGGFAGEIQGRFSLRASGPENLVEVQFMIDNVVVATDTTLPFNYQFETDQYSPGAHTLTAVGILSNGTQISGTQYKRVFLSANEAREATFDLVIPILVGVGGIVLVAAVLPFVLSGKNQYQFKKYGVAGGAVCPRCLLPFSRNFLAPNMLTGKLERCPHCGKWAIVRQATPQELADAENRYSEDKIKLQSDPNAQAKQLRKSLDETKYE